MIDVSAITAAINAFVDPYLRKTWGSVGAVTECVNIDAGISCTVVLGYPAAYDNQVAEACLKHLAQILPVVPSIRWNIQFRGLPRAVQPGVARMPKIHNTIAVASGKGGVGKSTVAVNLALALASDGARVGLLDADIYGPSQPILLGQADTRPSSVDEKHLEPVMSYGIASMSIGYLVDADTALIWRGPMVSGALQQLLNDTQWPELDYLIIDLPPGTGDIHLTLSQKIPVSGVVVVTTPQPLAIADARRAYHMFRKVNVPVLGIIENMSSHLCAACGHEEAIFGQSHTLAFSTECDVPLLGHIPLDRSIQTDADNGCPTVVSSPDSPLAKRYRHIARATAAELALQAVARRGKIPMVSA